MATAKEAAYDAQINPLMAEIIRICKEHQIAFLASFALGFDSNGDDPDNELLCTSCGLDDQREPPDQFLEANRLILSGPRLTACTITTIPGER